MSYKSNQSEKANSDIENYKKLSDPGAISVLFHEKKGLLLKLLMDQQYNIKELEERTGMNPGTIKRHLDDLEKYNLIKLSEKFKNEYGFVLKYYRATARYFEVNIGWPEENRPVDQ